MRQPDDHAIATRFTITLVTSRNLDSDNSERLIMISEDDLEFQDLRSVEFT
jgi:hypothetical protein